MAELDLELSNLTQVLSMQVMKAGITASQRRRRGDNGLTLAMDPKTRRLLRYEEVHHCTSGLLASELPVMHTAVPPWHIAGLH